MTLEDAYLRTNRPELVDKLVQKGYIVKKRNKIFISFLDEERESINRKSLKLRAAGRKGGLSSAKARLKHKEEEIEEEEEKDARKEIPYDLYFLFLHLKRKRKFCFFSLRCNLFARVGQLTQVYLFSSKHPLKSSYLTYSSTRHRP